MLNKHPDQRKRFLAMIADVKNLTGYLCDLNSLESSAFQTIKKRKILSNVGLSYQDVSYFVFKETRILIG